MYNTNTLNDFIEIYNSKTVRIHLKYSTIDNFTKQCLYPNIFPCLLHKEAWNKFTLAIDFLEKHYPNLRFIIFDAFRPRSIQKKMFSYVENTPEEIYVANPQKGSMHNYGMAIDLSLETKDGQELDMGTEFDAFTLLAQPKLEQQHLQDGFLKPQQYENRLILREAMVTAGGFIQLPHEWWHYNAFSEVVVKETYKSIE